MRSAHRAGMIFLACIPWLAVQAKEPQDPALGKYPLEPGYYKSLVENGFLPSKPHIGIFELATKLNLELPQVADVKAALQKKDQPALEKALGAYLNSRLRPMQVAVTGKPPANAKLADQWLQPQIRMGGKDYPVGGTVSEDVFPLGDDVDWYRGSHNAFVELAQWGHIRMVGNAYANSGDPKYAEAMIRYVRSFYRTAGRPPAQRPKTLFGTFGPWRSLNASGRIMGGYMPATYQEIGAAKCVTDADRVMFLTIFWEHAEYCHLLLDEHVAHNFEIGVLIGLLNIARTFPEFTDSTRWLERCGTRFGENLRDCTLDDGGLYERTGYHFAVWSAFMRHYQELLDAKAPLPAEFAKRLEKMTEASIWILSPTLEFPLFGLGDMNRWKSDMERAASLFPARTDFAHVAGGKGKPPERLARVLPYTGWLTMRSDWSPQALYLAFNFNGNPRSQAGHYDQASFGLWAYGRPWMTNPGTCEDYSLPEYRSYVGVTRGANTIMVDETSQDRWDNSGRLESWEDLPAFTYASAANGAYRGLGGTHRRSILFVRSERPYWLMVDRIAGDGKPHDYRWLGHFQPTTLTVDPKSKAIATAVHDGKRLWVVPARPESFEIEQGQGPLVTAEHTGAQPPYHPARALGPHVALLQKKVPGAAEFAVLLAPGSEKQPAPLLETLAADTNAIAFRLRQETHEDLLLVAPSPKLRHLGSKTDGFATDAEVAVIRREAGKVVETAMAGGSRLGMGNVKLLEIDAGVRAVSIRYRGDMAEVAARGAGTIRFAKLTATKATLNGKPIAVRVDGDDMVIETGKPAKMSLTGLVFATDPVSRCKGIGVPRGYGGVYQGPPQSALVRFQSSVGSHMTIEWRRSDEKTWNRMINPEPLTDHLYLLTDLEDGRDYQVRVTCRTDDGAVGDSEVVYTHHEPEAKK